MVNINLELSKPLEAVLLPDDQEFVNFDSGVKLLNKLWPHFANCENTDDKIYVLNKIIFYNK